MDYEDRWLIARQGEDAVLRSLRAAGFSVTDLNKVSAGFPLADLLVDESGERVLIQVKSTTTECAKFIAPSKKAEELDSIASVMGLTAVYAFVHFIENAAFHYWEEIDVEETFIRRWARSQDEFEKERIRLKVPECPIPFSEEEATIRFASATQVARLARRAEDAVAGTCRYTVSIDDFVHDVNDFTSFVTSA